MMMMDTMMMISWCWWWWPCVTMWAGLAWRISRTKAIHRATADTKYFNQSVTKVFGHPSEALLMINNYEGSYCRPKTFPKVGSFFPKMCSDPQCIKISIPTLVFRGGNKNALAITFANILRTPQLSQSLELMGNSEHMSVIFNFERNSHDLQHPQL